MTGRSAMQLAVPSSEPSSTTITCGNNASAPVTTSRMRSDSLSAGISTATLLLDSGVASFMAQGDPQLLMGAGGQLQLFGLDRHRFQQRQRRVHGVA